MGALTRTETFYLDLPTFEQYLCARFTKIRKGSETMNSRRQLTVMSIVVALGILAACSDESDTPREECVSAEFSGQQVRRLAAGKTHYLPTLDDACGPHAWALSSAPDGNRNTVVQVDGDHPRFTPTIPGVYVFSVDALQLTRSLSVVAASDAPFEHYNYYPGLSVSPVGDELWVAAVYSPEVIRLDPDSMEEVGRIAVGPWPVAVAWQPGMTHALVAHKAGDTLGVIDLETTSLIDAIWVGDEPANVVVNEAGTTAFVALSTEAEVAVVDVQSRTLNGKIETNFDPLAMAFDSENNRLFVASHRSGDEDRTPLEPDPRTSIFDVAIVDVNEGQTTRWIESVGSTIGGMTIANGVLYIATTRTMPKRILDASLKPHSCIRWLRIDSMISRNSSAWI